MSEIQELQTMAQAQLVKPVDNLNVNACMRYIYDQMESALIVNYVVLGDAGLAIKEKRQIDTDLIEIGISAGQMTPEVVSLFNQWGYKETDKGWETSFEGIKILFRVIKKKYKFLEHVDVEFYDVDEYKLPNPWSAYWKIRQLIQ